MIHESQIKQEEQDDVYQQNFDYQDAESFEYQIHPEDYENTADTKQMKHEYKVSYCFTELWQQDFI